MASVKLTKEFKGILKITPQQIEDMNKQHADLILIRGKIVESTIEIEQQLNWLISNILFGGIQNRASNKPNKTQGEIEILGNKVSKPIETKGEIRFFENFILNTNHLSFMAKIKILRSLRKVCSFLNRDKDCKVLVKNLQDVAEWRDKFAHGSISFKTTRKGYSKNAYLFYYEENKPKEKFLNQRFFDNTISLLFSNTRKDMEKVRNKVNKLFKRKKPTFYI